MFKLRFLVLNPGLAWLSRVSEERARSEVARFLGLFNHGKASVTDENNVRKAG